MLVWVVGSVLRLLNMSSEIRRCGDECINVRGK